MIYTLMLFMDVLLVAWLVLAVVREAKPGGDVSLGWLSYRDQLDPPPAKTNTKTKPGR
ncbi:MAG: hypothetical protein ACK5QH_09130 [Rubrivivax sp.]|jgi:hypothetical protein